MNTTNQNFNDATDLTNVYELAANILDQIGGGQSFSFPVNIG